jgi:phage repressor protein C with HTH and peptisase S24 domain
VTCVPLLSFSGRSSDSPPELVAEGDVRWVALDGGRRLRPGMFVARVQGRAMEPRIPDGSYCLFGSPVEGSRHGRIVLFDLRDDTDPETGQRYTIRRFEFEGVRSTTGPWREARVKLLPLNPGHNSIVLSAEQEEDERVLAEVLEVLPYDGLVEP